MARNEHSNPLELFLFAVAIAAALLCLRLR